MEKPQPIQHLNLTQVIPKNQTAQTLWNNSPETKMLSADVQARTEFPVPFSNFGHLHTVTIQLGVQEPDLREEITGGFVNAGFEREQQTNTLVSL